MTLLDMPLDEVKKLQQKKHRQERRFFLAEGEHLILELGKALRRRPELASSRIIVSHDYLARGLPASFPAQLPRDTVSSRQLDALSDTQTPQGVMAIVPFLSPPPPIDGERVIYLHEIQDPGNLGTILRTLAWFGGFRCLLSPGSVDPYNSKVVRASMGAIFSVPFETEVPLKTVEARYPRRALLDLQGRAIACDAFHKFDCYLFGGEARGVPAAGLSVEAGSVFSIPSGPGEGGPSVESLNLATTVNLCAYELAVRSVTIRR